MGVAVTSFLIFAASQVGTPGPANMALLTTGARFGLRRALPFVAGVALGKQLIIWPIGFGLMGLATQLPFLFEILKWVSVAYICWLAWKVAFLSLKPGHAGDRPPGFMAGLIIHPLNPKAWVMITAAFTSFVEPGTSILQASAIVAMCLLGLQVILHPLWCWGGQGLARVVAGTVWERYLMVSLAVLTILSVLFVVLK